MAEGQLQLDEDDEDDGAAGGTEIDRLLGMITGGGEKKPKTKVKSKGQVIRYTRAELLKIAVHGRQAGWMVPQGLGGLETWFG